MSILINKDVYLELETLTGKIEKNTATLADYKRYETLLINAGLPREYIFSYLQRAGFNSWEHFYHARSLKEAKRKENIENMVTGGIIGIGLGILISSLMKDE